jgi:hypothetical protein
MRAQKTETEVRQEQIIEAALELIGSEGVFSASLSTELRGRRANGAITAGQS